jgi:hypothetical protein
MKTSNTKRKPCRCRKCGAQERLHKLGRIIVSNISHALGLCGDCVSKEAGL